MNFSFANQDASVFFRDGVIAIAGGMTALVHLDWPEEIDNLRGHSVPGVVVGKPKITYATGSLLIGNGTPITVDGVAFEVCHTWKLDDGLMSCAELNKPRTGGGTVAPPQIPGVQYGIIPPVEPPDGVRTVFHFVGLPPSPATYLMLWNGQAQTGYTRSGNQIITEFVPKADDDFYVYH